MSRAGLPDLTAFAAVAEHGSFRAAARALEVTPSALSHTMRALEARLGVRLFNRTTRSVALTEAGQALLQRVGAPLAALKDAVEEIVAARERPSGSIRISSAESGAAMLIRNVLPAFLESYPDIQVEFVIDGRMIDIVAEGFDAGVRLLEAVPQDMVAARFGPDMRLVAIASPAYLAQHERPAVPTDLLRHRCIRFRFDSGTIYRWELGQADRSVNVDVNGPMTLGNVNLMVEAALNGIGIAWVPEDLVVSHIAAGRLINLLPAWSPAFPGFCLYYPANRHPPTALRLFAQAVRDWSYQQTRTNAQPTPASVR